MVYLIKRRGSILIRRKLIVVLKENHFDSIILFQTPVSPLLKPADPIFNQVLMKDNQDEMLDYPPEKEIPVLLVWTFGGKNVSVEGSWDHWKTRYFLFFLLFLQVIMF
jgi:hypothetical protein